MHTPLAITYADLLRQNAALASEEGRAIQISVLSNITITPIKEVLEFSFRVRQDPAEVMVSACDNIAQESLRLATSDAVLIFYEVAGLLNGHPVEALLLDANAANLIVERAQTELTFVFDALKENRIVVFNLLSALPFSLASAEVTVIDDVCDRINRFAHANAPPVFRLIDVNKVLARCSVGLAIDLRLFAATRSLYRLEFLRAYSELVYRLVASVSGRQKKILVLDCDNTLWSGTIAEAGIDGIRMFVEIQSLAVRLVKSGVLLCLCSKNNANEIDTVLADPRMVLKDEHIVIKAVNWDDKCTSLQRIAQALNVGLDSLVFVDDSDFELNLIQHSLPAVLTVKVPREYSTYLFVWQSIVSLFSNGVPTRVDKDRTALYRTEFERQQTRGQFKDVDGYLASLRLAIRLTRSPRQSVERLAQLTQRTNQFNLTTRRMTASEIEAGIDDPESIVIAVDVRDRFGDYGTSGLIIIRKTEDALCIDQFLLSCRVLGRKVEVRILESIIELLRDTDAVRVIGVYRATAKNAHVARFYSDMGFTVLSENYDERQFEWRPGSTGPAPIDYIEVELAN